MGGPTIPRHARPNSLPRAPGVPAGEPPGAAGGTGGGGPELIPTPELLARAGAEGIRLSRRALRLYASRGLVPHPTVRNLKTRGRTGYYSPAVLYTLRCIWGLKAQGQTLDQIRDFLRRVRRVAERRGVPPEELHREIAENLGQADVPEPLGAAEYWAALGRHVLGEMVRRGHEPRTDGIASLHLDVGLRDGGRFRMRLYSAVDVLTIRALGRADGPRFAELQAQYAAEFEGRPPLCPDDAVATWLNAVRPVERLRVGLAEQAGDVLGAVALAADEDRLRRGAVRLDSLYVEPELRRQGIGTRLLEYAAEQARGMGGRWIDAWCAPRFQAAIAFLLTRGFAPAGTRWRLAGAGADPAAMREAAAARGGHPASKGAADLVVRLYRPGRDAAFLASLSEELAVADAARRVLPFPALRAREAGAAARAWDGVWLALAGDRAVGRAVWLEDTGWVDLAVLPAWAGRGVDAALLEAALAAAEPRRRLVLYCWTADGREPGWARPLGFTVEEAWCAYRRDLGPQRPPGRVPPAPRG